jgi:hypothetical protein
VFDGHGGKRAADFAKENLPQVLSEELHADASDPGSCLIRAFEKTDEKFITGSDVRSVFRPSHFILFHNLGCARRMHGHSMPSEGW